MQWLCYCSKMNEYKFYSPCLNTSRPSLSPRSFLCPSYLHYSFNAAAITHQRKQSTAVKSFTSVNMCACLNLREKAVMRSLSVNLITLPTIRVPTLSLMPLTHAPRLSEVNSRATPAYLSTPMGQISVKKCCVCSVNLVLLTS